MAAVLPGQLYTDFEFYVDPITGELQPKHLLVLAFAPSEDIIFRPVTSRATGRNTQPRCFHGYPYSWFYLGQPGEPLTLPTWIDMQRQEDIDPKEFDKRLQSGAVQYRMDLDKALLLEALNCIAAADDTTRQQHTAILDTLSELRSHSL